MLHLEHINLFVRDMEETLKFYGAAFPHWRVRASGNAEWYGTARNWLHFGDDYQYLAFNDNGEGENRDLQSMNVGLDGARSLEAALGDLTRREAPRDHAIADVPRAEPPEVQSVSPVPQRGFSPQRSRSTQRTKGPLDGD